MRHRVIAGVLGVASAAIVVGTGPDAKACGGCFAPTQSGTVVTDHRMIFAISPQQTTLYDEIEYQGAPESFAWVLPIRGQVAVGLSADSLFAAFNQATQTTIVGPQRPTCQSCTCGNSFDAPTAGVAAADAGAVTILAQQVVGPYQTVQLQSSDPNALNAWLTANGYVIPASVAPVVAAYVNEGFDFLALRLVPGQGVQAMRPVSVTSPGAGLSLPLRMVAAGTGATVGITLWVVADGRYEPASATSFLISPSELTWDFSTNASNYTTVRAQKEAALNDTAWQIESSLEVSPYSVENPVLYQQANDYASIPAADAGAADGGPIGGETAEQVRQDDLATVFAGGTQSVRVTRMRADLSQAALAKDLTLQASQDQSELSNLYNVTAAVNVPVCPPFDPASCDCGGDDGTTPSATGFGGENSNTPTSGMPSPGQGTTPAGGAAASSGGCAVGPAGAGGTDVDFALTALVGLALVRARKKSR
jgi:Uncharacterized protein conserved in bacteria (DUF2330)